MSKNQTASMKTLRIATYNPYSSFEELNPAQERLILSCIAHGNTIRRAIDADVVE